MLKLNYKLNGVEMNVAFEEARDMILFVAANKIKDEDLVSVDLGAGLIGGGIEGLANYYVEKITKEKEEEALAEEFEEEPEDNFYVLDLADFGVEDRYVEVENVVNENGLIKIMCDDGNVVEAFEDERLYIVKDGENVHPLDVEEAPVIRVRAQYIHKYDILVNM